MSLSGIVSLVLHFAGNNFVTGEQGVGLLVISYGLILIFLKIWLVVILWWFYGSKMLGLTDSQLCRTLVVTRGPGLFFVSV